jgi:hypothetical protein
LDDKQVSAAAMDIVKERRLNFDFEVGASVMG